jgi:hypothetical protein
MSLISFLRDRITKNDAERKPSSGYVLSGGQA